MCFLRRRVHPAFRGVPSRFVLRRLLVAGFTVLPQQGLVEFEAFVELLLHFDSSCAVRVALASQGRQAPSKLLQVVQRVLLLSLQTRDLHALRGVERVEVRARLF